MLSQDYNMGAYMVNSAHTTVTPQSSLETPTTQSSSSSRSLPRPASFHVTEQPPQYNFTDPISFDNNAFSENLKYYMGEVQASTNVDLSHVTAELPQVITSPQPPAEQDLVLTPQPVQTAASPVNEIQDTNVVLRKKPRNLKEEDKETQRDRAHNEVSTLSLIYIKY
jgi:hypothetical protein